MSVVCTNLNVTTMDNKQTKGLFCSDLILTIFQKRTTPVTVISALGIGAASSRL